MSDNPYSNPGSGATTTSGLYADPRNTLNADKLDGAQLSTDGTLASDSDLKIPTEQAVKEYVDTTRLEDFTDGTFRISNTDDATKDIAFDASGITTGNTRTITMADEDIDLGTLVNEGEWDQNGFATKTTSTLTWTDSTPDRTLSIQPTGADFEYWIAGVKYTSTGDTVQITDVEGIHAIYYDGSTLTALATPAATDIESIILTKAIVSIVYWDTSGGAAIYVGEERHGKGMSPVTHNYLHSVEGMRYVSGLGLNTMSVDQDGSSDTHAQFGVDAGGLLDEDIYHNVSAVGATTGSPIYYMTGAGATWNKHTEAGFSVRTFDGTGSTRLAWNEYTGGAWQLTEITNTDYVLYHIFGTSEKDTPIVSIMGQNDYATKGQARAGALTEIMSLVLDDVLFPEIKPLATVIMQARDSYSNAVQARIVSTDEGDNYVDWRNENISGVSSSTSDHGDLTGLGNDDHSIYRLIAGRDADYAAKTADYTATATDTFISLDGTSVAVTLTLPTAAGIQGKMYGVKAVNIDNACDVDTDGAETIDGDASYTFASADESIIIISDGTNWQIYSKDLAVTATAAELNLMDGLTAFKDEDDMASDSDTAFCSQQSIKKYIDDTFSAVSSVPAGTVIAYGATSVAAGYLACDGSAVNRTTYSALFTAISTTWGVGDGSTTFNVPDLRGAFLRGTGSHGSETMVNTNAYSGAAVGSFEDEQMFGHFHERYVQGIVGTFGGASGSQLYESNTPANNATDVTSRTTIRNPSTDGTNGIPRTGDENRPFNAGVNFLIKT